MADLDDLLLKTSRTFALSIPLLPDPTRTEVTVAYLLFRIADTFEDAARWPRRRRLEALEDFGRLVEDPAPERAEALARAWTDERPASSHEGYLELLAETPGVMEAFRNLAPGPRASVGAHTLRTTRGMAGFVARHRRIEGAGGEGRPGNDGDEAIGAELELESLQDLRDYCYVVAGIVGEMLTELFLFGCPTLEPHRKSLTDRAATFGEALQLVNILKDAAADAEEGRTYLPATVDRAEVFRLARTDLETAARYVHTLQDGGAPRGMVAFTALPVQLAWGTLDRVEDQGPGAKLTRSEVAAQVAALEERLDRGEPAVRWSYGHQDTAISPYTT